MNRGNVTLAAHSHGEYSLEALVETKRRAGWRVLACIPARDEEATLGAIVSAVRGLLEAGLVDELVAVDDGSKDATAAVAAAAGATVLPGPGEGKGEAMRVAKGRGADIVVFLDGDVENFGPHFVSGLLGPMLNDDSIMLVKGCYARPLGDDPHGGGRVTELVAKPLLSLLFPDLESLQQPLAGETAVRAAVLEKVELEGGYGVEMGLVLDVAMLWGATAIAQVDLGTRRHRNRSLAELSGQARDVLAAALVRTNFAFGRSAL
jgi:glucosyl-3-phosphoglycerate synthase